MIRSFRDLSLRRKLYLTGFLTTSIALLLVSAAFVSFDYTTSRRSLIRDMGTLARILGANSSAALIFGDAPAASETLSALAGTTEVASACIFDAREKLFASFAAGKAAPCDTLPALDGEDHLFAGDHLILTHRIAMNDEVIGTIVLRSDLQDFYGRLARYGISAGTAMAVAFLVALFIASLLYREIVTPLSALTRRSRAVATGDLSLDAPVAGGSELATLAGSFNHMAGNLRKLIAGMRGISGSVVEVSRSLEDNSSGTAREVSRQESAIISVNDSVDQVVASAREVNLNVERLADFGDETTNSILQMDRSLEGIASHMDALATAIDQNSTSIAEVSTNINTIATGVESLRATTEDTVGFMSELVAALDQVEHGTEKGQQLSENTSREAQRGMQVVVENIVAMREINTDFQVLGEIISRLASKSDSIGRVIKVIDDLADATNLLALNATIIAAQAGEHGSAFAVVAGEVKNLAQRTAGSTREIAAHIKGVQEEVNSAVSAMAQGSERVEKGVALSNEAGETLRTIIDSSRLSSETTGQILEAVRARARELQQVDQAMRQVREIVNNINRSTQEQERSSTEIAGSMEHIRTLGRDVKRSTQEQSEKSRRIAASAENVRSMIRQILAATKAQTEGSENINAALSVFREVTVAGSDRAAEMKEMVATLSRHADELRDEIGRFRT